MQRYITDSNYGSPDQEKLPIDYDPSLYDTKEAAAKALYEAIKPVVTAYGQNPDSECGIYTPEQASQREYGHTWVVWWEAGPYEWAIPASMWISNPKADWFTEPHFSFDLTFTS